MVSKSPSKDEAALGEFEIIARYFAPLAAETPGAFGLTDDTALLTPPEGKELVVTVDMLVAGEHFRAEDRPGDVAWKALAVNVSDLVAKGAEPLIYLLAISLPKRPDLAWLQGLTQGLKAAQAAFGCRLAGGDTTATSGPATLSVTAIGAVPEGQMVRRAGARAGDAVYVSGTIGDSALGLGLLTRAEYGAHWGLEEDQEAELVQRYWRPLPRVALAPALRAHASAAMDISDGLVGDLRKLCEASGVAAEIQAPGIPLSQPARIALDKDPSVLEQILTGGDDYEILTAVPEANRQAFESAARGADVAVTQIGRIGTGAGVTVLSASGEKLQLARDSYDHF